MSSRYANDDGRFTRADKSNPMPDKNLARVFEFLRCALGYDSHLVLGHFRMRFVFDPANFAAIFRGSNRAPKNDDTTGLRIVILRGQIKRRFGD